MIAYYWGRWERIKERRNPMAVAVLAAITVAGLFAFKKCILTIQMYCKDTFILIK